MTKVNLNMAETLQRPEALYRGITLPAADLDMSHMTGPLTPGSRVEHPDGTITVADGNPFGVYMSTNINMVMTAYADPRHDGPMPGFERLQYGVQRNGITVPNVGLLYKIDPLGLDIRSPKIIDTLRGVDNNGFEGEEWIADFVPANHVRPIHLKLGTDTFFPREIIEIAPGEHEVALHALQEKIEARNSKMRRLAEGILELPLEKRKSEHRVGQIIKRIRDEE